MTGHMAIGDGNGRGSHDGINEAILALGHGNMIYPDVGGSVHGYGVAVALRSEAEMAHGVPDHATAAPLDVMDVQPMDDDVLHKLQRDLSSVADMNVGPTRVYGLVACHQQLLGQPDHHVA